MPGAPRSGALRCAADTLQLHKTCRLSMQFDGGEYEPDNTPLKPPVADVPGATMRFQFAGVST